MRRSRIDIKAEIIEYSLKGIKKTELMYKAGLSFRQTKDYLPDLEKKGLLRRESTGNGGRPVYITSDEGRDALKIYKEILY